MTSMSNQEALKIQAYLQQKFQNPGFTVRARAGATDSIEVLLNNEFIGVVYKDDDDRDDISYDFNMAILAMDLPA